MFTNPFVDKDTHIRLETTLDLKRIRKTLVTTKERIVVVYGVLP